MKLALSIHHTPSQHSPAEGRHAQRGARTTGGAGTRAAATDRVRAGGIEPLIGVGVAGSGTVAATQSGSGRWFMVSPAAPLRPFRCRADPSRIAARPGALDPAGQARPALRARPGFRGFSLIWGVDALSDGEQFGLLTACLGLGPFGGLRDWREDRLSSPTGLYGLSGIQWPVPTQSAVDH